jgi:hypothetical protein
VVLGQCPPDFDPAGRGSLENLPRIQVQQFCRPRERELTPGEKLECVGFGHGSGFLQVEHLANRLSHALHGGLTEACERAPDEAPIIDCPELVYEEIGSSAQTAGGGDPYAERLRVIHQRRGKGHYQGGRVAGIEKCLGLDNEDGAGLARFCAAPGM